MKVPLSKRTKECSLFPGSNEELEDRFGGVDANILSLRLARWAQYDDPTPAEDEYYSALREDLVIAMNRVL